jgi:Ca2+-binding RTX toxin-like protein
MAKGKTVEGSKFDDNDTFNNSWFRSSLKGTDKDDKMYGKDGNDILRAREGNDLLNGGRGSDTLLGEAGNDKLVAETGHDYLYGGSGNDRLEGGPGHDYLFGDTGNDNIHGGSGNDRLLGAAGDDKLYGNTGDDKINGWTGRDHLVGGPGKDTFSFSFTKDSPRNTRDRIEDFSQKQGDKIDIKAIDANKSWGVLDYLDGNEDFNWKTQLTYKQDDKGDGIFTAQVRNGDDLQITLTGYPPLDLDKDIIG